MFGFGPATRIYVAAGATDMRKNFNGLYGLVRDHLGCDPESGPWVCSKKLDGGCFRWPGTDSTVNKIVLSHEELTLLLGSIDLKQTSRMAWYRKVQEAEPDKLRNTA